MALTAFGRELTTTEERDLVRRFEIYTPNGVSDPKPEAGGVRLASDWKGGISPAVAKACLAIVVQEPLAGGIA